MQGSWLHPTSRAGPLGSPAPWPFGLATVRFPVTQSPTQRSRSAEKWGQAVWPRCYLGYFPEPVSPGKGSDPLNLGVFSPELCPRLEEQGCCRLFRPHSLFRDCAQGAEPEAHVGLASRVGAGAAARLRLSAEGAARWLFIPCTMAPRTARSIKNPPAPRHKARTPLPGRAVVSPLPRVLSGPCGPGPAPRCRPPHGLIVPGVCLSFPLLSIVFLDRRTFVFAPINYAFLTILWELVFKWV